MLQDEHATENEGEQGENGEERYECQPCSVEQEHDKKKICSLFQDARCWRNEVRWGVGAALKRSDRVLIADDQTRRHLNRSVLSPNCF
jgi:hypothetical protein